jgi:RNase P/RNase MRP subunit p29
MRDYPVRKCTKMKSPLLMYRKKKWERVTEIRKWGKNWAVSTEGGTFVVDGNYLLHRPNATELKSLLS